ncbi:MAG TPA: hypothetical protein VFQ44_02295 [Streptosporangiaceae bacterium]|nr:hypothetical protein [Streptosporangiaceae bacterium]
MGWASAGNIFDPVAQALIDAEASDELKTKTLSVLIRQLTDEDWDTEYDSLDTFQDDPAIVEAFRQNGTIIRCDNEHKEYGWCYLERGHGGDFHEDDAGNRWPAKTGDA